MSAIGHEAITASAGSGKTFQLAHRYITLLAAGVKPERIAAFTFSRKAAGEIFESIVAQLCRAAGSDAEAAATAARIGRPDLARAAFLDMLNAIFRDLNRLHVGTLDSFIVGIARAFPLELGLPAGISVIDTAGAAADAIRRDVLARIFNRRMIDAEVQKEFLEAFKQATFGAEEKGLERNLSSFIGQYREYRQALPLQEAWGDPSLVWPKGCPWLAGPADPPAVARELLKALGPLKLPARVQERWETFAQAAAAHSASMPWSREVEYLFEKLAEKSGQLEDGTATLKVEKTEIALPPPACDAALELLRHVMATELRRALERTRGIYRVLHSYEEVYDEAVRRRGRLTFSDMQFLLTESNRLSGGAVISREPLSARRLYIDYRLDCRLDHWLLDEFQDTSDLQWEVLRNLADEILQDSSGERSFFCVGDVKQAIYGWRGGNARLFGRILDHYGPRIRKRPLATSFRSCRPIIDTVNRIFGNLPADKLPAQAAADWSQGWQEHTCSEAHVPRHGYAAVLEPLHDGTGQKQDAAARYHAAAALLNELAPLARGLSTAVLARTNKSGRAIVSALRAACPGLPVVHEGRATILDNMVVPALLSLVKLAAHPGDTLARQHVRMSPLGADLPSAGPAADELPVTLLSSIAQSGFQAFMRAWGARLAERCPLDEFGQRRLDDLLVAAGEFDRTGKRDCNAFIRFIESYEAREQPAQGAVRVMTIHQAKGLGFDIVILPDLQDASIASAGQIDFVTARHPQSNEPLWALRMPRRAIADVDPVLARERELTETGGCFEELCVLYVALTRAKRALYMITSYAGRSSTSFTPAAMIKSILTGSANPYGGEPVAIGSESFTLLHQSGEPDWYRRIDVCTPTLPSEPGPVLPRDFHVRPARRRRLVRAEPSAHSDAGESAARLFETAARARLDFGSAVHAVFEKIEWAEEAQTERILQDWLASSPASAAVKQAVGDHVARALSAAEIRQALARPGPDARLWREKRFDIVLDETWVSGVFDRVILMPATDSACASAVIQDFKTDAVSSEQAVSEALERYRPQLHVYRRALAQALGLPPARIGCQLIFTFRGCVRSL